MEHLTITIEAENQQQAEAFLFLLNYECRDQDLKIYREVSFGDRESNPANVIQILVTLGSAGVFSLLFSTLSTYIRRNQKRKITIQNNKKTISIEGHSINEEKQILEELGFKIKKKKKN